MRHSICRTSCSPRHLQVVAMDVAKAGSLLCSPTAKPRMSRKSRRFGKPKSPRFRMLPDYMLNCAAWKSLSKSPVRRRTLGIGVAARGRRRRRWRCWRGLAAGTDDDHQVAVDGILGLRVGKVTTRVALFFVYEKYSGLSVSLNSAHVAT